MLERNRSINVRVSDEEIAMLAELADADGVSQSDFLRLYVRRTYAERFGTKKPGAKKKER
jgi:uncharacterized protein (DUF1778 family)